MKIYKGIEIRTTSELRDPRGSSDVGKNRVIRVSDEIWERIGIEARRAGTSIGEIIRAVMLAWLNKDHSSAPTDGAMDEDAYLTDLARAKYFQRCDDENAAFWIGYVLGLHKGHDGDEFQCPHEALIVSDDPKGVGYRAGIDAYRSGVPYND